MATKTFFNLPQVAASVNEKAFFGTPEKHTIHTNWHTFEDQSLSLGSLIDVFANRIPAVRVPKILTGAERRKMLEIIKTQNLVFAAYPDCKKLMLNAFCREHMTLRIRGRGWELRASRSTIISRVCDLATIMFSSSAFDVLLTGPSKIKISTSGV